MQEEHKEIYKTADVILLIMKYEGEIEDLIEYPSEFEEAYKQLLLFDIIKSGEGKYLKSKNFDKASRLGFKKYVEKGEKKIAPPSKYKKIIMSTPALGIFAGAIFLTAAYLVNTGKNDPPKPLGS